jgi:hypothetical protein
LRDKASSRRRLAVTADISAMALFVKPAMRTEGLEAYPD